MSADHTLHEARQLLLELAAVCPTTDEKERVEKVLEGLAALAVQAERHREADARLEEIAQSLFALAARDFSRRPKVRGDGSLLDAVSGCVNMLAEELAAYHQQRDQLEQELERRVALRTAELQRANEELRREIEERIHPGASPRQLSVEDNE